MSMSDKTAEQKKRINASQTRYRRDSTRLYSIRLYKNTESDLIDYIESMEGSKTNYFRQLIRADMEKHKTKM